MTSKTDKLEIKAAILELIKEENSEIKELIKTVVLDTLKQSEKSFDNVLNYNFKRFDVTFKALA